MKHEGIYTLSFALVLSVVAGTLISTTSVVLKDKQEHNQRLELERAVIHAAGLTEPEERLDEETIRTHFEHIRPVVVDLRTGELAADHDPAQFDRKQTRLDPATSHEVPENAARVARVPPSMSSTRSSAKTRSKARTSLATSSLSKVGACGRLSTALSPSAQTVRRFEA